MKGKKTGGRKKGTPNKLPAKSKAVTRRIIADFLAEYMTTSEDGFNIERDWALLEPFQRISIAEKMMQYVVPKCQATQLEVQDNNGKESALEKTLREMSRPDK